MARQVKRGISPVDGGPAAAAVAPACDTPDPAASVKTRAETPPADDLAVLAPDVVVTFSTGERRVARELTFGEQLHCGQALSAFADQLAAMIRDPVGEQTAVLDAVAANVAILPVIARAFAGPGLPPHAEPTAELAWLQSLKPEDGELAVLAWWQANQHFFVRRLLRNAGPGAAGLLAMLAGALSSPPSSATATAPSQTS